MKVLVRRVNAFGIPHANFLVDCIEQENITSTGVASENGNGTCKSLEN